MIREDYIIRLIRQFAEFLARIAGHTKRREYDAALEEADRAWTNVLEVPRELVDRVDSPTLAAQSAARAREVPGSAARLLTEEASAYAGKRDPLHAGMCYRRAYELYLEARAIDPTDADDAAIFELSRLVPPGEIDPRYRAS